MPHRVVVDAGGVGKHDVGPVHNMGGVVTIRARAGEVAEIHSLLLEGVAQ